MKKVLLMFLASLIIIGCEPIQIEVSNNTENIENVETEDDDNLNGGLEDPIENPEMDW